MRDASPVDVIFRIRGISFYELNDAGTGLHVADVRVPIWSKQGVEECVFIRVAGLGHSLLFCLHLWMTL